MPGLWLLPTCALLLLAWLCFYFWGFSLPSLLLFIPSCRNSLSHRKRTNRRNCQHTKKPQLCSANPPGCRLLGGKGLGNSLIHSPCEARGVPRSFPHLFSPWVTCCSPADHSNYQIQLTAFPAGQHRQHEASLQDTGMFTSLTEVWAFSSWSEYK